MSSQSENVRAPNSVDVVASNPDGYNSYGVVCFKVSQVSTAFKVPHKFKSKYCRLYVDGGNVMFAFSKNVLSTVDITTSPTNANADGLTENVGGLLADGIGNKLDYKLPYLIGNSEQLYLIAQADADNVLIYLELTSG